MLTMRYEIDKRFKEQGIEIPFPQRTMSILPKTELGIRLINDADRQSLPPEVQQALEASQSDRGQ